MNKTSAVSLRHLLPTARRVFNQTVIKSDNNIGHFHQSLQRRLFSSSDVDSEDAVKRYLRSLQIPSHLDRGILRALKPLYGPSIEVSHLEALGCSALEALADSVAKEQTSHGSEKRTVTIQIPHHGTEFELDWNEGESLLQLAQDNPDLLGEYMEGTCGGNMSCCTCHVYLDQQTFNTLGPPSEAEEDMLDLAHEPKPSSSRLGCQVVLGPALLAESHTVSVGIPSDVNNVWN